MTTSPKPNGVLVGTTKNGITTPCSVGLPSVRAYQTPRASHFFTHLRAHYGSYGEAIRRFPDIRRILDGVSVLLSGGYERHKLPIEHVFHVLADNQAPSTETVHQSLTAMQFRPSAKVVKKYLMASQMVAARINKWLDEHPAWDHYAMNTMEVDQLT